MNPALPKPPWHYIYNFGKATKRKGWVNPALPNTNRCIYDFGEVNKRKSGDSLAKLGIAKKGRAG